MKEKRRQRILEIIRNMRLMDDAFMTRFFDGNLECTSLMLQIIIEKPDLKVLESKSQYYIKNLQGHSAILDVKATDDLGTIYDIEIQRASRGAEPKRARYNSSLMDANFKVLQEETEKLPSTYVIMITENDVLRGSKPIYHVNRIVEETGKGFEDESHIIYVNGKHRDDSPLGKLMHDFHCSNPAEMKLELLAKRARYFKEEEEGVKLMSSTAQELWDEIMQEGYSEGMTQGISQGISQGAHNKAVETAKSAIAMGLSMEQILKLTGLSTEEIEQIKKENS
ncbi:MAG: Rpn family recombination-promoting nuclease/putative transposase [Treponema sp.]|uniref:Rpn family recombination-promoting nuclease/putative transposase n=1 Tax=Treponema sp. TaxID=166 RepID=UPI00298EC499|nr:Rpn family recombination-promoting nuclease/putative transposase [Treponema sp.]MCQ2601905.1 Rpn family recombination-promoting nuclease/putative transposase [Treponema sp.]